MEQSTIKNPLKLMLIDDDPISNFLSTMAIKKSVMDFPTIEFQEGESALDYLFDNRTQTENLPNVILLDLNMPGMDGWQFLEAYTQMFNHKTTNTHIYVLSSSISPYEISRAKGLPVVKDFFQCQLSVVITNTPILMPSLASLSPIFCC